LAASLAGVDTMDRKRTWAECKDTRGADPHWKVLGLHAWNRAALPTAALLLAQVQQLEDRLKELEEERKELAKFQRLDKQRRSLEYTIYDKEVAETRAKLEQVWHRQTCSSSICLALCLHRIQHYFLPMSQGGKTYQKSEESDFP
jgi:hypothetical protein